MFNPRVLGVRSTEEAEEAFRSVGPQVRGASILTSKAVFRGVKLHGVGYREANIAKQEMLGSGGDVATGKGVANFTQEVTDIVVLGTLQQYRRFITRMRRQPFQCRRIAEEVQEALANYDRRGYTLRLPRGTLELNGAKVMGILNVTPDSFSDGGRNLDPEAAIARALEMEAEGATVIDIGGESTRPGAKPVPEAEEWARVGPVLQALRGKVQVPLSIDTYKPGVARKALEVGASLVNDVRGMGDPAMIRVVAEAKVPAVIMHMQGEPGTMQVKPAYRDVVAEVLAFLRERRVGAMEGGVEPDQLLVDPGIGFGKTLEHNLLLIRHLAEFRALGAPLVVGVSRKGFIGQLLDSDASRVEENIAAAVVAVVQGAHLVRAHDVGATIRAVGVANAILRSALEV